MPVPGLGDVHVSSPLTQIAIGYPSPMARLTSVFPVVRVDKENNTFYKFQAADFYRDEAEVRAPDAEFTYIDYNYSTDTYQTVEYSAAKRIPDRVRRQADAAIISDIGATKRVMDKLTIKRERIISVKLTTTANWSGTAAAGGYWNQNSGAPLDEIETGNQAVQSRIGLPCNTGAMSWKAFRALRRHPQLMEHMGVFVGTGQRGPGASAALTASLAILAELTSIPNWVISDGIYNSAAKGQSASMAQMMADTVWIGYTAASPALDEPSAGYVFEPDGGLSILQWREPNRTSDVVGGLLNLDCKVTAADAGYTITDVLS